VLTAAEFLTRLAVAADPVREAEEGVNVEPLQTKAEAFDRPTVETDPTASQPDSTLM
jgi:hypothetical protein